MKKLLLALALALPAVARADISFEPEPPARTEPPAAPDNAPAPGEPTPPAAKVEPRPPPAPPPPPKEETWSAPAVSFNLTARLSIDTAFEGSHEVVANFYRFATASVRTNKGKLRVLLSARLRWVSDEEAPTKPPFWLFNGTRPRSQFEPSLGETAISGTNLGLDWSAGFLDVTWGQNPAFSPVDILTPVDTRDGPMPTTSGRIPIPALRVKGTHGIFSWDAVYQPVFVPSKLPLIGNDWVAYPLAGTPAVPDLQEKVDPTTFANVESSLGATQNPQLDLTAPQGGLRLSLKPGPVTVSATWAEFFDRQPVIFVSPGMQLLLKGLFDYGNRRQVAELLGAAQKLGAEQEKGIPLITGEFIRTRIFGLDAALTTGPLRWTVDAGYSPQRVFARPDLTSILRPMLSGAAGVEWEGPPVIAAGVYSLLAMNIPAGTRILFVEPSNVSTERQRNASLSIAYLVVHWMLLDDRLELGLSGFVSFRGDWSALPGVHWRFGDAHSVGLGANIMGGPPRSLGLAYARNNQAWLEYVLKL